jgi:hypothetical protein
MLRWALVGAALSQIALAAKVNTNDIRIVREGDRIEFGNACLARVFTTRPTLATVAIINRLTGKSSEARGTEFVLDLGQGRSLPASEFSVEAVTPDEAAGTLVFRLRHAASGIGAVVSYELTPGSFFMRKRLTLETGSTLVRGVEVERLSFGDAPLAPLLPDCLNVIPTEPANNLTQCPRPYVWDIGLGQPVFVAGQVFLGLEHPAGHNAYDKDGTVFLRHYPGKAGRIECKPEVLGVAADQPHDRVRDAFLRYVEGLRTRPVKRFTEFFFDTQSFDKQAREIVDTAREALVKRGVRLDCVTLNGWAEPRQGIMVPPRDCPDLLKQLTSYAQKQLGCPLGLHVYTTGKRSPALRDWIARHFDMIYVEPGAQGRGGYCLADPRAEHELTANLARYAREHGVAMYYYDWGAFNCPAGNHRGHMPGYGTEAIADAFIRQLEAMRAVRPDIFLCDTGWFSPWWLRWYDGVYYGPGGDWNGRLDGPPSFATVDLLGTWRDRAMKQLFEKRPCYPATGYINHGAISYAWMDWRRRASQPRQAFVNYVAMMFLLGPQIAEYILALPELSEENRDDLAAVHRWGLARDAWLLADTRPLGGDPMKGEVYGFAHVVKGNRGVIGLRNPTVFEQSFKLVCDEQAGFGPADAPFVVATVYPFTRAEARLVSFGDTIEMKLAPHELRVLEIAEPSALPQPMTLGCREQLLKSTPTSTTIALLSGAADAATIVSPVPMERVLLDGKPCAIKPGARQASIRLPPRPAAQCVVRTESVSLQDRRPEISLRFTADVPDGVRAKLLVVFTGMATGARFDATITCNGKPCDVEAPHRLLRDSEGRDTGRRAAASDWNLFRAELPTGRSDVQCVFRQTEPSLATSAVGSCRAKAHVFVDAAQDLPETHRIEIRHPRIAAKPLPSLPTHWNAVEETRTTLVDGQPIICGAPTDPRNIALAAGPCPPKIEVDSIYPDYTNEPLNDGVVMPRGHAGDAWASAEMPQEHSVTLTWPRPHKIGSVFLCWGQSDWLPRAHRVECRVNGVFVAAAPPADSSSPWLTATKRDETLRFKPVTADAVRVVQKSGGGSDRRPNLMGIAEIAVHVNE